MSPFEKRIANYQKSAEMRKQSDSTNQRSGSRGRPPGLPGSNTGNNFYQNQNPIMQHQTSNQHQYSYGQQESVDSESDIKYLRGKSRHIESTMDDYILNLNGKQQEYFELNNIFDHLLNEQSRFLKQTEKTIHKAMQQNNNGLKSKTNDNKNKSVIQQRQQRILNSPKGYLDNNKSSFYPGAIEEEDKIVELQKNNDQMFKDLRNANEKYLAQKVENNKIKEEIQTLQTQIQELNQQLNKQQSIIDEIQPNQFKSLIQKKGQQSSTQRVEQTQNPIGKQNSNTLIVQENENLKNRICDLEKEYQTLLNYQNQQKKGFPNPNAINEHVRSMALENQELKGKVEQLCLQVQRFMFAMKRLQRAVNNKDKEIQIFKTEFESNKKQLELLVKETKENIENKQFQQNYSSYYASQNNGQSNMLKPISNSMINGNNGSQVNNSMMATTWDKRDPRYADKISNDNLSYGGSNGQRNKSQMHNFTQNNQHLSRTQNQQIDQQLNSQNSQSERNDNYQQNNIPMQKKGIIRPKNQQAIQRPPQQFNETSSFEQQEANNQLQVSPSQENQFNKLLEEIKQMQEERESQKAELEQLKQTNENILAEKNALDVQYKQKNANLQKLSLQIKSQIETINRSDSLLNDYKNYMDTFEQDLQNLTQKDINKIKTDLLIKEKELINKQLNSLDSNRGINQNQLQQQMTQIQKDQVQEERLAIQIEHHQQIQQLKDELVEQIQQQEESMCTQMQQLSDMLSEKEQELAKVKRLFVEKLKEIETSFVEISQEMVENEQLQNETSKRMIQQNQSHIHQQRYGNEQLEKSIENIMGKYEDEQREEELNQLVNANQELLESNSLLQKQIKNLEIEKQKLIQNQRKNEEFEALSLQNIKKDQEITEIKNQNQLIKKSNDDILKDKKILQQQLNNLQKQIDSQKAEYQQQINEYEVKLIEFKQKYKEIDDKRVFYESEYNNKEKQLKQSKIELQKLQNENERLIETQKNQALQIETLLNEQEYIKQLKSVQDPQTNDDSINTIATFSDEQEHVKIEQNPKEAALSYLRMLKATNKEYAILTKNYDKLLQNFEEQKVNLNELKQESRENVEYVMEIEQKIYDLEAENQKLNQELNHQKGSFKIDEENIKKQIEEQFKNNIQFKENEIESMSIKLDRIAQMNIELTRKCNSFEQENQNLLLDKEQSRNKISSLEMELEMTKTNTERDLDQLIEQDKERNQEQISKFDQYQKQVSIQEKQNEQEKKILQGKLIRKKEKLLKIKEELDGTNKKHKEESSLTEQIKRGLEQKLKEQNQTIEEEKRINDEIEEEKQNLIKEQQTEKLQQKNQFEKQKQELTIKYEKELEREKAKQGSISKNKEEKEQELQNFYNKQMEELEQRLNNERIQLEETLKQNEQQKLDTLKKTMEQQKENIIKRNEQQQKTVLEEMKYEKSIELQQLQESFNSEKKELDKHKKQELQTLETQLKLQIAEQERKQKKQMSLIQVLQKKAREVLLQEIKNQKIEIENEKIRSKQQALLNNEQQQQLIKAKELEKQAEIVKTKEQLEKQRITDIEALDKDKNLAIKIQETQKNDLKNQIEKLQKDHQNLIAQKQVDLEKAQNETKELIRNKKEEETSLKQQIASKDKQISELEKQQKNNILILEEQHNKEIKQLQDNINQAQGQIKDLKSQIQKLINNHKIELEKLQKEINDNKNEYESQINQLKQNNQIQKQDFEQTQQKTLQQNDNMKQLYEQQINQYEQRQQELNQQLQLLTNNVNTLTKEKETVLKQKEQDIKNTKIEQNRIIEELNNQNQNEMEQLKKKLEDDHYAQLKKKDQEKSLFEKLQEKVRQELKEKLDENEKQKQEQQKKIENLDKEIQNKEESMKKERVEQQELIDNLNISMRNTGSLKIQFEKENEKIKKELEIIKKQQKESEKELIKELRQKLIQKESECEEIIKKKNEFEQENVQIKNQLKESQKNVKDLEKDLEDLDGVLREMEEEKKTLIEENNSILENKKQQIQQIKEQLEKNKFDNNQIIKSKEALIKQLQERTNDCEIQLKQKETEIEQLQDGQSNSQRNNNKQLREMQNKHKLEIQKLIDEKRILEENIEQMSLDKERLASENLNKSINEIEKKIGEFQLEFNNIKQMNKEFQKQKQLNDDLISCVMNDKIDEIIGEIGSNHIQYCKRVKYLEKAWVLIQKLDKYYWVDQDKIPIKKIQEIVVNSLEETQGILQQKLEELQMEKEHIIEMIEQEKSVNKSFKIKPRLEQEYLDQKHQNDELTIANNQLQQQNLQLKKKIKELNDMVFGLTDSDKNHDNIKKIYDFQVKNEELQQKLIKQYQLNKDLKEQVDIQVEEIERLKNTEIDYSFTKGQQNNANSKNDGFPLEQLSIIMKADNLLEDQFSHRSEEKIKRLETELEEYQQIKVNLEKENNSLFAKMENLKKNMIDTNNDEQMEEALKHQREILFQLLMEIPLQAPQIEARIHPLMSMMHFSKEQKDKVQNARTEQNIKNQTKKGMFGLFGKKDGK